MNMMKIMKMMKNVKDLKKQSTKLTKNLKKKHFTGESHDGLIKVEMTGADKIVNIKFAKKVIDAKDNDMLSDLIVDTVNNTVDKINKYNKKALKKKLGDLVG